MALGKAHTSAKAQQLTSSASNIDNRDLNLPKYDQNNLRNTH